MPEEAVEVGYAFVTGAPTICDKKEEEEEAVEVGYAFVTGAPTICDKKEEVEEAVAEGEVVEDEEQAPMQT